METYASSFRKMDTDPVYRRRRDTGYGPARSDAAVEEQIWHQLLKDRTLGAHCQENIALDVEHGIVKLRGHVRKEWHIPLILNLVERVESVALVKSELVADSLLQEQVIRALLQDETTSPYIFTARVHSGWVLLGGVVPTPEIAKAAEGVVGFLSNVRGILSLPSVFGTAWLEPDSPAPLRRRLQPRMAATVCLEDEANQSTTIGLVSQVILDPCSRLVDAFAVRLSKKDSPAGEPQERLVPMTAVEAASDRKVWLKSGQAVEAFPLFDRARYPQPPQTWRPPFPYRFGEVRWSI